jgi:16S rRNA (guanine1207-N2)-methyltransferase
MEHYYSKKQNSSINIKKISQRIRGILFEFYTSSGVFSKARVDKGTLILAENMELKENSKLLDIGAGIGILGIVAAKSANSKVIMSEVNSRSVMLSKKNTKLNDVSAHVLQGDLYQKVKDQDFDTILSNPPQSAGKEICFNLIKGAKKHLKSKGNLQLVARNNKGGSSLGKKMQEVFGNLKVTAKKSGYWVYFSERE